MKVLGKTPDGGTIVELTLAETNVLQAAASALDDHTQFQHVMRGEGLRNFNAEKLFKAIGLWIGLKFNLNGLHCATKAVEEALGLGACEHKNVDSGFADAPGKCRDCGTPVD